MILLHTKPIIGEGMKSLQEVDNVTECVGDKGKILELDKK
jgi:hypothetical protein